MFINYLLEIDGQLNPPTNSKGIDELSFMPNTGKNPMWINFDCYFRNCLKL